MSLKPDDIELMLFLFQYFFLFFSTWRITATRCNTSYKPKTLNPTWNEDFVLDVNSVEQVVPILKTWQKCDLIWLSTYFVLFPVEKRKFEWFFKTVCLKDNLRVDVWDFNDEESVNDKFGKINQVGRTLLPWWSFFKEFTSSTRSKMDEVWGSS